MFAIVFLKRRLSNYLFFAAPLDIDTNFPPACHSRRTCDIHLYSVCSVADAGMKAWLAVRVRTDTGYRKYNCTLPEWPTRDSRLSHVVAQDITINYEKSSSHKRSKVLNSSNMIHKKWETSSERK
jgi:hypothetical protein